MIVVLLVALITTARSSATPADAAFTMGATESARLYNALRTMQLHELRSAGRAGLTEDALRERNVFLPIVSQIFLNGPYIAGLVITSLLLADVFNLAAAASSLMLLPRPITFSLGASFAGWLVERLGGRPLVVFGTTGIAIGLLMIGFGAAQDELWMVGVGVGIQGAGSGVARPPIIAALTEAIGDRDVGVGTGMLNMTGQLGAAAGISILSALVDDGSSAERFLAVLAIAAAIEIIAVAMVGAIRFRGPITTRTTPASPTAPYSAVVDLNRGRE